MYWNMQLVCSAIAISEININMRCIEIPMHLERDGQTCWLTLTWDVLKFKCIAIKIYSIWININMRCIEILQQYRSGNPVCRLTLTWDVLKWGVNMADCIFKGWLTLTWDVLKS